MKWQNDPRKGQNRRDRRTQRLYMTVDPGLQAGGENGMERGSDS